MKALDIILILLMIALLGIAVYFLIEVRGENGKCVADPLRYAVQSLESQSDSVVQCSCSNGKASVFFTAEGITEIIPNR